MEVTNQLKNQHLSWRAGFGPMAEEFPQLAHASPQSYYQALAKASSKTPAYIDVADNALKGLIMGMQSQAAMQQKPKLSSDQKRQLARQSREDLKNLNLTWLDQMVGSPQQLREKMSLFWHGHFASRNFNIFFQQQLLDVVRRNALGNFGDLLREVSKSAAMINFLNNNQNRKGHPNENFAREVMELFTMGRGHYTETDVKESARSFTGWGANINGEFVFRRFQHDDGTKTFLGKTGSFDGDDILSIILEQKQTARFITQKIYRYFVNSQVDPERIEWLSGRFYQSNYDIGELMKDIFTSDWFYDPQNIGVHIKSPVELIVGIRRALPMTMDNPEVQLLLQRLLGQVLFYPPNVAGWPGGKNWIDSSSLMLRLRIPQMIYAGDEVNMKPKEDDDQTMGMKEQAPARGLGKKGGQLIMTTIDWGAYVKNFDKKPKDGLLAHIGDLLLQTPERTASGILEKYTDGDTRDDFIKTATIQLMSTPEYQLC